MGSGSSTAQLPDSVDKAKAQELLGDDFDEAAFDAAAKDGVVDKATFLAAIQARAGTKASAETAASPGGGAAESTRFAPESSDLDAAKVTELHSRLRWNKDVPEIQKTLTGTPAMVHARDPQNGNYPLHIAAQNGHVELVRLLLTLKANPNKQNGGGHTALHMTTSYDMHDLSDLLLASGADPNLENPDGHVAQRGLDGKANIRYRQLAGLVEKPSEAALLEFFSQVRASGHSTSSTSSPAPAPAPAAGERERERRLRRTGAEAGKRSNSTFVFSWTST
jgi:hypothetical protein